MEDNLPAGSKIIVYANLMRLSSTKKAIEEQRQIDQNSLRKVDIAEENFAINPHNYTSFHALNLRTVKNDSFYDDIESYIEDNNYQYLVLSEANFSRNPEPFERLRNIAKKSTVIKSFGDPHGKYSHATSEFLENPLRLFTLTEFGPPITIYKLR